MKPSPPMASNMVPDRDRIRDRSTRPKSQQAGGRVSAKEKSMARWERGRIRSVLSVVSRGKRDVLGFAHTQSEGASYGVFLASYI